MANVTSVTKRDIGPKMAVAKAKTKTKEEQARSLLKPIWLKWTKFPMVSMT